LQNARHLIHLDLHSNHNLHHKALIVDNEALIADLANKNSHITDLQAKFAAQGDVSMIGEAAVSKAEEAVKRESDMHDKYLDMKIESEALTSQVAKMNHALNDEIEARKVENENLEATKSENEMLQAENEGKQAEIQKLIAMKRIETGEKLALETKCQDLMAQLEALRSASSRELEPEGTLGVSTIDQGSTGPKN